MIPEHEEQINRRMPIMEFLQGAYSDTNTVVIGMTLLVEIIDREGARFAHRITSDASGVPLPYYAVEGHIYALQEQDEFDEGPMER